MLARFTEVMLVWAASLAACGSATGLPMPQPGDAGTDVSVDAFVESESRSATVSNSSTAMSSTERRA